MNGLSHKLIDGEHEHGKQRSKMSKDPTTGHTWRWTRMGRRWLMTTHLRPWGRRPKAASWSPKPFGGLLKAGTPSHPKTFSRYHRIIQRFHDGLGPEHGFGQNTNGAVPARGEEFSRNANRATLGLELWEYWRTVSLAQGHKESWGTRRK